MELKQTKVVFDKASHTYHLGKKELQGVTPIVSWLFPETYAGIPQSVMDASKEYGAMIHSACQLSDMMGIGEHESVKAYQQIKHDAGLTTIANEFLVSDEKSIASSIDVVCTEAGQEHDALIDIKTTSKVLHNHLAVQLSIYAYLYEAQTGHTVGNLYCIWLPKERYGQPALIPVQRIDAKTCKKVVSEFIKGNDNEKALQMLYDAGLKAELMQSDTLPAKYQQVVDEVIQLQEQLKAIKERDKTLRDGLLQLMRESGAKKWQSDKLTITYVAESKRQSIDSTKLKKYFPDVYAECLKESNVSDSIKITIN